MGGEIPSVHHDLSKICLRIREMTQGGVYLGCIKPVGTLFQGCFPLFQNPDERTKAKGTDHSSA